MILNCLYLFICLVIESCARERKREREEAGWGLPSVYSNFIKSDYIFRRDDLRRSGAMLQIKLLSHQTRLEHIFHHTRMTHTHTHQTGRLRACVYSINPSIFDVPTLGVCVCVYHQPKSKIAFEINIMFDSVKCGVFSYDLCTISNASHVQCVSTHNTLVHSDPPSGF